MKTKIFIILLLISTVLAEKYEIRVLLKRFNSKVTISSDTTFFITEEENNKLIRKFLPKEECIVNISNSGIKISNIGFINKTIKIKSLGKIKINSISYNGEIYISNSKQKLLIINKVSIEQYLFGIINHEISDKWPIEAIKAQVVAARTYSLLQKERNKNMLYDLDDSTLFQVYGGVYSDHKRIQQAIILTKGEALMFNDNLAFTPYHSTCSGHTEDTVLVWQNEDEIPYLKGVVCNYCWNSPHFFWQYKISRENLRKKLVMEGYIEKIKKIELLKSETGRVISINIVLENDSSFNIKGNMFRKILGFENLRSMLFDVKEDIQTDELLFTGKGWGHGVGMCQWGAKGMAEAGIDYKTILNHYYPGTSIKKIY